MITDEQIQQQSEIEKDNNWLGTFVKLPQVGDVYEFDYVYNERGKTTERLIVVDVTDTHVMYKMPGVSVNKIFPMDHETWKANTDERRKVEAMAEAE